MKIEVLGPGCAKCAALHDRVNEVVARLGISCEVTKVTDITEFVSRGIMMTPALVVDGEVKSVGKVPSVEQLVEMLQGEG